MTLFRESWNLGMAVRPYGANRVREDGIRWFGFMTLFRESWNLGMAVRPYGRTVFAKTESGGSVS
jgi:hypothetical protein